MTRFMARVLALAATSHAVVISWRTGMRTPEQSVTVASDEDVTFEWSGNHNVRLVTKEEFDRCDKTNAVAVGDRDESPYTMLASGFARRRSASIRRRTLCAASPPTAKRDRRSPSP